MTETSRLAALLRSYGIGTRMSLREAARLSGVSRQTLSDIMRAPEPGDSANVRQQRKKSLRKIADAFDIPFDLVEREAMADWGLIRTVSAETVQGVMTQLQDFDMADLATIQMEIARIQRDRASGRQRDRTRPNAGDEQVAYDENGHDNENGHVA